MNSKISSNSLCHLCVLCASVVTVLLPKKPPQRHRELRGGTEINFRATTLLVFATVLLCFPAIARAGNWANGSVTNSSGSLNYKIWIPTGYTGKTPLPLVMMLHGCTQTPDDFAAGSRMNVIADQQNFLVVYPEQPAAANALKCWNWFEATQQSRGHGEPSLMAEIVRTVSRTYKTDTRRVYVAGVSAGGAMAVIMAATYADIFAAVGVQAGLPYKAATGLAEARPAMAATGAAPARLGQLAFNAMGDAMGNLGNAKHVMRVIVFQGTKDGAVSVANADRIIAQWAKTNDLIDDAKDNNSVDDVADRKLAGTVPNGYAFTEFVYNDHRGKPLMEKWIVEEMKHAWSGGAAGVAYSDPKGPDASMQMWRFFRQSPPLSKK
jgi:poly(hydroxyalkanoate) depolymerase family esterase